MKTLESIREEIWEEMLRLEDKRKDQWADIKYQTLREVLQKLGHLDEPEVLSQELPVIPKFVSEWIKEVKKQNKSIVFAIAHIYDKNEIGESPTKEENRIFQWMESANNDELFARAWLDGYEVEEEQKYYVLLGNQPHDDNWTYALTNSGSIEIFEKDVLPEWDRTKLTEQEIKDYDERYWPFAVKVEGLEE